MEAKAQKGNRAAEQDRREPEGKAKQGERLGRSKGK